MPASDDQLLESFHRTLVEEIRRHRPEYIREEFTVAEIYQDLVPYRTHRDRIGVEMNGDYEATLLRLLAGEGEYLVLGSEAAREEITSELAAANPDTSLFRQFAALDVRLNPGRLSGGGEEVPLPEPDRAPPPDREPTRPSKPDPTPLPEPDRTPVPKPDPTPLPGPGPAPDPTPTPEPAPSPPGPAPTPPRVPGQVEGEGPAAPVCHFCRGELPRRRRLRYCPHCGTGIHLQPCPECGEELERGWRFCVACGTGVGS